MMTTKRSDIEKMSIEFDRNLKTHPMSAVELRKDLVDFAEQVLNAHSSTGTLYEFLYNCNVHESSWATVSIHYSMDGAEKAMNEHKELKYKEWLIYNEDCIREDPEFFSENPNIFGEHEDWYVKEITVLP